MDPWQNPTVPTESVTPEKPNIMNFEDNFEPVRSGQNLALGGLGLPDSAIMNFERVRSGQNLDLGVLGLPDSAEYLARLEQRLNKLKMVKDSTKSLIESLSAVRESRMIQLLSNEESIPKEINEEIVTNRTQELIMRRLAPEKQAISIEELVALLKADQLAQPEEQDS